MKRQFLLLVSLCVAFIVNAQNYLCFTANEDNCSFALESRVTGRVPWVDPQHLDVDVQFSVDGGETWDPIGVLVFSINKGDKVYLKGNNPEGFSSYDHWYQFVMNGSFAASGSVMSLIDGKGESTKIPSPYCFYNLFSCCENLTQAPELPATELESYCYSGMFSGCKNLSSVPVLPSEDLSDAHSCYSFMFYGCTGLTEVPDTLLPSIKLSDSCYDAMFDSCVNLRNAPKLPAMALKGACYSSMFVSCASLEEAPALPATTLASECYFHMFIDCFNLKEAPKLPAAELADGCYGSMFAGCFGLKTAPALPAEKLADRCYEAMFLDCVNLQNPPSLPAKELADLCYLNMFNGCISLTQAPVLPSTELDMYPYVFMFKGCTNLSKITVHFDRWEGLDSDIVNTNDWVLDVAPEGTFICPDGLEERFGSSYIPEGWTVVHTNSVKDCPVAFNGSLYCRDGHLFVSASERGVANICNINGQSVKTISFESGETDLGVFPVGVYVVNGRKVFVE